jgi:hypothetical protein
LEHFKKSATVVLNGYDMLQNGQIENFSGCYEVPTGRVKELRTPLRETSGLNIKTAKGDEV